MAAGVIVGRSVFAYNLIRRQRIERRYQPIAQRALAGDEEALHELVASPSRYRIDIAYLLILPLIGERDTDRITRTRAIIDAMSLIPIAERMLHSRRWSQRALALRALGLLQVKTHSPAIVAALDDGNAEVRAAALDAIADLRDTDSLPAIVLRLHDASLHPGRRAAVIAAFGSQCEPLLLEVAETDVANRLNYAQALAICGTDRSRPALCWWTQDPRPKVRAAAFEALAHVGLDQRAAFLAIDALETGDVAVRAMAAHALHDWSGPGEEVASCLARHLDDSWPVAVKAARSLRTLGDIGSVALQAAASRSDLAGMLARQTLWGMAAR
jgi:HEAT repeat protein